MGKFILWRKIKTKLIIVALVLSSVSVSSQTFERDSLPPEPEWYYYFTILGKDINQNGIRDDLEAWISLNSKDINEYRLYQRYAFFNQKYLENAFDSTKSKASLDSIKNLIECFYFLSYKKGLRHDEQLFFKRLVIEEKIYNSFWKKIRRSIANIYSESDWQTLHGVKDVASYPKYCGFKIRGLKKIIEISSEEETRWKELSKNQLMEILDTYEEK